MTGKALSPFSIEIDGGNYLDLWKPDASVITVEGIATSLSKLCRYVGWCDGFYSVAEHAVLVAKALAREGHDLHTQLLGLHHDSPEAFTGDQSRPYKRLISELAGSDVMKEVERHIGYAVLDALGIPWPTTAQRAAVKAKDDWACAFEAFHLLPSKGEGWAPCDPRLGDADVSAAEIYGHSPIAAAWHFRAHHKLLSDQLAAEAA